jgi:oligopeptide/dipeptide ABC transporter ATP-binding protein
MTAPLLRIDGLQVSYRARAGFSLRPSVFHAVQGASLTIAPGETLGLVGESGSGKSSIANAVLGLVAPSAGTIRFDGTSLDGARPYPPAIRRQIQAVFQDPYSSLNPAMTVEAILTGLSGAQRRARALELLGLVGLDAAHLTRHPHQFSGGQRQRIAIAAALALQPRLIVLDEPVSALDVSTQNQIINLLYERRDAQGLAYLLIAHDLALVHHISDRIAVMYLGRIVEQGPATRVYARPAHPYTQALLEAVPLLDPARQRERRAARRITPSLRAPRDAGTGCPFRHRCPEAMPRCADAVPPPYDVPGGGVASCFLFAPEHA